MLGKRIRLAVSVICSLLVFMVAATAQTPDKALLRSTAKDASLNDTIRMNAMHRLASEVYVETMPDSALHFAQSQLQLATSRGYAKFHARALRDKARILIKQDDRIGATEQLMNGIRVYDEIGDHNGMADCYMQLGGIYLQQKEIELAKENFAESAKHAGKLKSLKQRARALVTIGTTMVMFDPNMAGKHMLTALNLFEKEDDLSGMADAYKGLGDVLVTTNQPDSALALFSKAMLIEDSLNNSTAVSGLLGSIGGVYLSKREPRSAEKSLLQCLTIQEETGDVAGQIATLNYLAFISSIDGNPQTCVDRAKQALSLAMETRHMQFAQRSTELLYVAYANLGKYQDAFINLKLHRSISDSLANESSTRQLIRQQFKFAYERRSIADSVAFTVEKEVQEMKIAKQQDDLRNQRIGLGIALVGLVILLLMAVVIYRGKKRSDELLLNILPYETAQELKRKGKSRARHFDQVTVLFTDFKAFTEISEQLSPQDLVAEINTCFSEFDRIMEKYGVEKIKTIGDAYMAAGGLPTPNDTHAIDVVRAAKEIQQFMAELAISKQARNEPFFEVRIGVHSGPVVAGIVGIKKFQYDIWGDTVNTANRMETNGEVGRVNISESTFELINESIPCEYRGEIEVKGKGRVKMYFVS